jgi:hypothetical protein
MRTTFKLSLKSALISLALILTLSIMELVNRRAYHEGFPFVLFFAIWTSLFAICLILLPVLTGRQKGSLDPALPVPEQRDTWLTSPRPAVLISVLLLLSFFSLDLHQAWGWQ